MIRAVLGDVHGNLHALEVVLDDIKKNGITEIYSVGDVVGLGPKPVECLDLIIKNNIKMVAGNAEEYVIFGPDEFPYLHSPEERYDNATWTKKLIRKDQMEFLKKLPHTIEINEFNKKLAICHFPVDVRYDYTGIHFYKREGVEKFFLTNTKEDIRFNESNKMTEAANKDPLFNGNTIDNYDMLIYGHYHFKEEHNESGIRFYSVNGTGVAINECATYLTFEITEDGVETKTHYVPYDKKQSLKDVLDSNMPNKERFILFIGGKDI